MDVDEKDGVTTKTFYDAKENVQAVIISDNNGTIVAVPNESINRKRKMSDEEYKCLKKCKKSDGGYDMNCVLLCPVTKQYQIFVR